MEGTSGDHLVQPPAQSKVRLLGAVSSQVLHTPEDGTPRPVPVDNHPHRTLSLDTAEIPPSDKSGSVCIGDSWHRLSENQQDLRSPPDRLFPTHPEWTGRISPHLGLEQGGCSLPMCLGFQTLSCAQGRVGTTQIFSTPCCPVEKGRPSQVPPSSLHHAKLFWPPCPFPGAKGHVSERSQPVPLV